MGKTLNNTLSVKFSSRTQSKSISQFCFILHSIIRGFSISVNWFCCGFSLFGVLWHVFHVSVLVSVISFVSQFLFWFALFQRFSFGFYLLLFLVIFILFFLVCTLCHSNESGAINNCLCIDVVRFSHVSRHFRFVNSNRFSHSKHNRKEKHTTV